MTQLNAGNWRWLEFPPLENKDMRLMVQGSTTRWERFLPLYQCPVCFRVHSGIPVKLPTRVQNISKTCLIFSQTEGESRSRSPEGRQTSTEPLGGSWTQLHDAALSRCHCSPCSPALFKEQTYVTTRAFADEKGGKRSSQESSSSKGRNTRFN